MIAVPIDNKPRLTRPEYWKRVGLFVLACFLTGVALQDADDAAIHFAQTWVNVLGWFFGIFWGIPRCRDAGWNPWWSLISLIWVGVIVLGIPKSKLELRLAD